MVKKKSAELRDDDSSTESNDDVRSHNHHNAAMGETCVHIKKSLDLMVLRKKLRVSGLDKQCSKCLEEKPTAAVKPAEGDADGAVDGDGLQFEEDLSLWLCLKCGTQLCGVYRNKHAMDHYKTPRSESHALVMNTTDFKVWCYQCDVTVNPKSMPRLMECVEFITREAEKAKAKDNGPPAIANIEEKLKTTADSLRALSDSSVTNSTMGVGNQTRSDNVNYRDLRLDFGKNPSPAATAAASVVDSLPRLRGLSNLGNTCYFNAVLQCLARTPFLLEVLQESAVAGEKFQLPGGVLKLKDGTESEMRPINGELNQWGPLTEALAEALAELKSSAGGVFSPQKLRRQLIIKCSQFAGMDQHDSHELLRHLLESVRNEDLRRYQLVILLSMGYGKNVDPASVEDSIKEKIKYYGLQAADRILRPEQVFRGFLVSTLTCQDCHHVSPRHESFLDLSLPVSMEKPQPPNRRKGSPEPDNGASAGFIGPKPMSNKERRRLKKADRAVKRDKQWLNLNAAVGINSGSAAGAGEESTGDVGGGGGDAESGADNDGMSDADVEDNLTDDSQPKRVLEGVDQNGNQSAGTPVGPEKTDDTPENPNKGVVGEKNVICEFGLSVEGVANMMEKININNEQQLQQMDLEAKKAKARRQRTLSHSDWGSTLVPRYQCEENECSIQSCLNSFTAVELMTGNNKVCCEACTKRINGENGKSVNTNATKQFLISSPPAVMILHLKRFQVGPRGMLRKMTKTVTFPLVLDIAPFCGSRIKRLPNVKPGQKKLLYSLYGIVEHTGTMHGGHYVAYVKVRPQLAKDDPRWAFIPKGSKTELDQEDEQAVQLERELAKEQARRMTASASARDSDDALTSSSSTSSRSSPDTPTDAEEEGAVGYSPKPETLPDVESTPGKWYYVSDSHVREIPEENVLNAEAYLLFYERIF
ncbi:ubiquitin carboxyl-terminal hydrolase 16 [Toxorhynchites rutilus septentrionalis]|uniref:ubiquitin carboxyl-terminal hydrolase 16 n=1 Tax=Toxorhynchites rutilus septentrionalis TaxID=329112 RepID=UPI00247972AA|nr:ubiquitin carboxyl-terminal hydrolase 16 [Toxorhynchites rutilus septentrionalis]